MNGEALLLASLATLWFAIVTAAWLWLGVWLSGFVRDLDTMIAYWSFMWLIFGLLGMAPIFIYTGLAS